MFSRGSRVQNPNHPIIPRALPGSRVVQGVGGAAGLPDGSDGSPDGLLQKTLNVYEAPDGLTGFYPQVGGLQLLHPVLNFALSTSRPGRTCFSPPFRTCPRLLVLKCAQQRRSSRQGSLRLCICDLAAALTTHRNPQRLNHAFGAQELR